MTEQNIEQTSNEPDSEVVAGSSTHTKAENELSNNASESKNVKRSRQSRCCRPRWKFHSLKMFVFLICLLSIFTNLISGKCSNRSP